MECGTLWDSTTFIPTFLPLSFPVPIFLFLILPLILHPTSFLFVHSLLSKSSAFPLLFHCSFTPLLFCASLVSLFFSSFSPLFPYSAFFPVIGRRSRTTSTSVNTVNCICVHWFVSADSTRMTQKVAVFVLPLLIGRGPFFENAMLNMETIKDLTDTWMCS